MSRLAEYRKLELQLASQTAALENMKKDAGLQKEMEFETKLRKLLSEYGRSLPDVIALLDPQAGRRKGAAAPSRATRRPREVKVYKHPETGETVETKGGNHRLLKQWKLKHGAEKVETWRTK
ncbi:histone-like nucleoid-structuring protein, MvaT/MvaU family [Pseudomonas izuensis]|uniref:histone-like nucleoid-structuring protein, MvaT/MvaU family n=1 Tax=Pseudomonas izuensis TaxID=2684212 RepID=UPI0013585935|nr:histone-like nucleoid-structuring protein, MvaT/MvaU family [Pseudomonas izuensis]